MQIKATSYCFALFYLERILYSIYVLLLRKVEQFYKDIHIDTGLTIESRNPHVVREKKDPGCVWNATPRSLLPLERNTGFWTQA